MEDLQRTSRAQINKYEQQGRQAREEARMGTGRDVGKESRRGKQAKEAGNRGIQGRQAREAGKRQAREASKRGRQMRQGTEACKRGMPGRHWQAREACNGESMLGRQTDAVGKGRTGKGGIIINC
jgi:hypothetical protein